MRPRAAARSRAASRCLVPDAVLRVLAAGIGLPAVPMAEAGIDPQRDLGPRHPLAQLVDHVRRAAVDVDTVLRHQLQRLTVEDVRRVDDGRRLAGGGNNGETRRQSPGDLPRARRVDEHPLAADEVEDAQVRAGLLGVAHAVEGREVRDPAEDRRRVVDEDRGAELADEVGHRDAGDLGAEEGEGAARGDHQATHGSATGASAPRYAPQPPGDLPLSPVSLECRQRSTGRSSRRSYGSRLRSLEDPGPSVLTPFASRIPWTKR